VSLPAIAPPESSPSLRIAVYPGSFDPITNGHLEIVERALQVFDRVIVAVGRHATKPGYFPMEERLALIAASLGHLPRARVDQFEGLVVRYCATQGARAIVRGLRGHGDVEPEFQMALANRDMAPDIETVFLVPRPAQQFVSSSLIREIAHHGGEFERYVPAPVAEAMHRRRARQG
jgi:pantetheine-phosphate adenylyltransferase